MSRTRNVGLVALAIALLAALAWGFRPRPVLVEVAVVERGPLRIMVEEEGQTRVKDRYVISAPVAGYLQRIELDVGDNVSQGQTLALLEPLRPEVLDPRSQARAEAQVAAAEAPRSPRPRPHSRAPTRRSPRHVPRPGMPAPNICARKSCVRMP
jgi:HlyD family secretion protein